jgi:hypothetical protein
VQRRSKEKILRSTGLKTFIAVVMAFHLSVPAAAAPVIGIATARGDFQVNSLRVSDNATLFEGSTIETAKATSEVRLTGGSRVVLGPGSKGTIYKDRALLEKGQGQIAGAAGFTTHVGPFRIESKEKGTARFALLASNRVRVSAVDGAFAIRNARGLILANVAAGNSVELNSQGSTQTKIVGKLKKVDGKYFVTDEATNTTLELKGQNLEQFVGQRVEVVGSSIGSTVTVTSVTAAAVGGGVSTTAVVAGVLIVSGVGAGVSLALTQEDPKETTSR